MLVVVHALYVAGIIAYYGVNMSFMAWNTPRR